MNLRRVLSVGMLAGILLSLSALYPVLSLIIPSYLPRWGERPIDNELLHGLLLMISAGIGIPTLLTAGVIAVRWGQAWGWLAGLKTGVITGGSVGLFVYITLVAPLNALLAYNHIANYLPSDLLPLPPTADFILFLQTFERSPFLLEFTMVGAVLLFGLQGLLAGWWWRQTAVPTRPTLYQWLTQNQHPRQWLAYNESTLRTGILVGVLIGSLAFFAFINQTYIVFALDWPDLDTLLRNSNVGFFTGSLNRTAPLLWPLITISLWGLGAAIVIFSKDPPDRFASRLAGTRLATHIVFMFMYAIVLRVLFLHIALLPFWLSYLEREPSPNLTATIGTDADIMFQPLLVITGPQAVITAVLVSPWIFLILTLMLGWFLGTLQGAFYTVLVPALHKQPVDKAFVLYRRLTREPNDILQMLNQIYTREDDGYNILPHLAAYATDTHPEHARLLAAYHSLGKAKKREYIIESVDAIEAILQAQSDWRWSADFHIVYHASQEMLAARTLQQIISLEQIPEQQTSSLPPVIVRSVKQISRIVMELHKVEKVEDLSVKLIFLENSLAVVHEAEKFAKGAFLDSDTYQTVPPFHMVLTAVLENVESVVLTAVKNLKGRADITATLQNQATTYSSPLPLTFQVANRGLNVAQQIRLHLLPGSDYRVMGQEHKIEILPPGQEKQVTLMAMPHFGTRRLRVEWAIMYDDAVDANRKVTFADVLEFAELDKPFQRIFPIPYVTGTPLKTDDVFVGRDDVFAFIKENLLGAHQNNVIILHGQRRTGKTSVLYRLGQVLADTHVGVLIDMQGKPARGEVDFLYSIADDIVFALEDRDIEVDLPPRSEFEESPEFYFRSRFLRGLYPPLESKNLLLLFDEFEELQRRVEDGRLHPNIFQFLRNLMQHESKIDFVFSGTNRLEDLGAEYWSVLFNIAAYKPITFLSDKDVRWLISEPVKSYNVEYDPLAVNRIIDVTAGHPYFTQLVLHEMIVYHNETQRNYLTVADVNYALEQIVERGEAHFKYIWSESTPQERLVLQALTELLVSKDAVSGKDVAIFIEQRGITHTADAIVHILTTLANRDILKRKGQLYHFKVDLIRLWIASNRPSL